MIAAVDIGGTKVDAGLFAADGVSIKRQTVQSADWSTLIPLLEQFLDGDSPEVMAIGVAGPVVGRRADVTNLPWVIDADEIAKTFSCRCLLMNDLQAHAHGLDSVPDSCRVVLQPGKVRDGVRGLIAAGTGLGQCLVVPQGNGWLPLASEGSHASFAPQTSEDADLWTFLHAKYAGHVSWERVVSGRDGFHNLVSFYGRDMTSHPLVEACRDTQDIGALVDQQATRGDELATKVMRQFVRLYGAEAGNLALKGLTTGGMYISGGIAGRIKTWMQGEEFLTGFLDKGRFRDLLQNMPVIMVDDPNIALRGLYAAATH